MNDLPNITRNQARILRRLARDWPGAVHYALVADVALDVASEPCRVHPLRHLIRLADMRLVRRVSGTSYWIVTRRGSAALDFYDTQFDVSER